MKRLAMVALIGLVSSGAFAKSPLPSPVAQISTYGGFGLPIPARGVRVLQTGVVEAYEGDKTEVIAELDAEVVQGIQSLALEIAKLDGKVVDLDADMPICMDAPSTAIQVFTLGIAIETGARRNCHTYELQTDGYTPYQVNRLNKIMEGLEALAHVRNG